MGIITLLKILSDENRLRIINILKEYPLCVGEIQTILDIKQSNASRHLEKLKMSNLIVSKKKAQWVYYEINLTNFKDYSFINPLLFKDIKMESIYREDLIRFNKYNSSGLNCQDLRDVDFKFENIKFKK
jgi:ArsR family transcriptional regulator